MWSVVTNVISQCWCTKNSLLLPTYSLPPPQLNLNLKTSNLLGRRLCPGRQFQPPCCKILHCNRCDLLQYMVMYNICNYVPVKTFTEWSVSFFIRVTGFNIPYAIFCRCAPSARHFTPNSLGVLLSHAPSLWCVCCVSIWVPWQQKKVRISMQINQ